MVDRNEAGLIGAAHLLPAWMLTGYEGIIAVDVGGTKVRAGVVELNQTKSKDLADATVLHSDLWRHGDEDVKRDDAVERLVAMLSGLIKDAKKSRIALAPMIGIGCPGIIDKDGSIERGAQNLPGNWESSRFNLPSCIRAEIPKIGDHETLVVMHNDAVVQGLSQASLPAGAQALGRTHRRHRPWQRAVHQPRSQGKSQELALMCRASPFKPPPRRPSRA